MDLLMGCQNMGGYQNTSITFPTYATFLSSDLPRPKKSFLVYTSQGQSDPALKKPLNNFVQYFRVDLQVTIPVWSSKYSVYYMKLRIFSLSVYS